MPPNPRICSLTAAALLVPFAIACEDPAPPAPPTPSAPAQGALVLNGWPGPLRPHLEPKRDVTVSLHAEPGGETTAATCELPEDRLVQWTRSRLMITRYGFLSVATATTVEAIRLPGLDRVTGLSVQDSRRTPLELPAARLETVARIGGRCLIQPTGGQSVWSVPCPTEALRIETPVQQTWWLELACDEGEGWFEVDEAEFAIEHFPDELLREPRAPTDADRYRRD